ncbi:MAG: Ig-like domain-containing protein [Christensenellales bacterium]
MKNKFFKKINIATIFILIFCVTILSGCGQTAQNIDVDSIQISKKNVYLAEGQTEVLSAQVYPFNANNQNITWISSDESVVKVEDGFVTAIKEGDAVIEVISEDGGYKDTCNVLVTTASDNLALNNYNNLNMPPKDLEPIYNSNDYNSAKTSAKNNKKTARQMIDNLVVKANAEAQDVKQSTINVIDEIKGELNASINNLNAQKEYLAQNMSTDNTTNSIYNMFYNIQTEIIDGMKNIKQDMLNAIEQTEEKIESEEYTVQNKNLNGVTFVVISNNTNNA